MKTQAVDYLVKEFSEILGKIETTPMQDLLMLDAVNRAKKIEQEGKQDLLEALEELMSIVKIHSKGTDNNFAWAEMDFAQQAIKKAKGE